MREMTPIDYDSATMSVYLVKQRHGKGIEAKWRFDFHPETFSYRSG